jgi:hypothetical protein
MPTGCSNCGYKNEITSTVKLGLQKFVLFEQTESEKFRTDERSGIESD